MGVYLWNNEWLPWENTIAYYPLDSNTTVNDASRNNRNLTNNGTTFWVYQWVDSGYINGNMYFTWISTPSNITINIRYNLRHKSENYHLIAWLRYGVSNTNAYWLLMTGEFAGRPNWQWFWIQYNNSSTADNYYWLTNWMISTEWVWYNWVLTYDWATLKIYTNWVLSTSASSSMSNARDTIMLWWSPENSQVNLSNVIFEDKVRTADEISNYYNSTKANYWIS